MGVFLIVWLVVTGGRSPWVAGGLGVLLGGLIYLAASRALGAPEARLLPTLILERIRRRPG
jgi:hypothetical protein